MLSRNHALVAAMAALCTMFCAASAHAEGDGDGGVYVAHSLSGASVSAAPIRTVPLSTGAIYPAQYNGDVRDLPQVLVPDYYHLNNELPEPILIKRPPATGSGPISGPPEMLGPMPSPSASFAGINYTETFSGSRAGTGFPPDTNGDVGPTYYIQSVNAAFGIYSKSTGALVAGFTENQLWQGAATGTYCDSNNQGDPVVLYDALTDRWILTDFAFTSSTTGPFYQCIAVSKSGDPVSGGWWLYAVRVDTGTAGAPPANTLGDYPKFGLWSDCLYMGANGFTSGTFGGVIFAAISRDAMYSGNALSGTNSSVGWLASSTVFSMFPANFTGKTLPPVGTAEYFVNESGTTFAWEVRKFQSGTSACGAGSTLSAATQVTQGTYGYPATQSTPNNFNVDIVPQPVVTAKLDTLGDRLMQRVVYRNISGTESLWVVHSTCGGTYDPTYFTCASTTNYKISPQWAQLNVSGGTIATTPVQEQIYTPDATLNRWMPSIAVDGQGNTALGYSTSNGTSPNYPSIAYSGRLASDTLSQLPQTEVQLVAGAGSQNFNCGPGPCLRWGDYSAMTVDPADDCTFWYTNEYYLSQADASTNHNWSTRIGSFKFPSCTTPATYSIGGSVSGLTTSGLVLALNGQAETVSVPSGASSYTFPVNVGNMSGYAASILTQPTGQICTVTNATGTIGSANVTNVNVTCVSNQTITFTSTAPAGATVGGATYTVTATASSGLAVTLTIDASSTSVCSLSGSTSGSMVSFTGVGTCTIDANQAGNANYNAAPQAQQSFSVGKGSQTITFTSTAPAGAVVGGAAYTVTATGGASGNPVTFAIAAASSGVCTISGSTVSFTGVGTCTIDANQAGNTNYNAAPQAQQSFSVGKGNQTITFTSTAPAGAVVGGAAYTVTATGGASGNAVTFAIDAASSGVCSIAGSTVSFTGFGTCTIDANQAGNANYNAAPQAQQSFAVGKGNQTITFTSTAPAGATVGGPTYTVTATGGASGNAVTFAIDAASNGVCTISGSTVSFTGTGTCTIDADQAGNANYNAALQAQQSFAVGKGSQTITFPNPGAQTYSPSGTFTVSATASSGLAVAFSSTTPGVCTVAGSTVTIVAAGTCTIAANQAGDSNYNAAPTVSDNITINPASQTITFPNPGAQTYSPSGSFAVSATATSGLAVAFSSTTPGVCTVAGSTVTIVASGTCTIAADQAGNTNYNAAPTVSDNITINPASQTITFTSTPPGSATVGGPTYTVTASGGASGNAVTFTIDGSSSGVCSIAGSTVSFTGSGTCLIDANQAGNANYAAAPQAQQSVAVGVASQTITFPNPGPLTYSPSGTFALTATGGGSGNPVTYASNTPGVCTVAGSTATIVSAGTCSITANQAGTSGSYAAASPVTDAITINPAGQTIAFTSTPPASPAYGGSYVVSATGGGSGNPVSFSIDAGSTAGACSISGSTVSFTGTGTCVVDANQAGNANYTAAAQQQQSFVIAAANQTITFTSTAPAPGVLGGPGYTVTVTASSTLPVTLSIDAGSASVCSINGSVSGSTVTFTSTGTCTIDANQAGDANYNPAPQAQQSFAVSLGTVALVFTTQPADVAQGSTQGTIAVTEQNQYGYIVTSDNSSTVNFTVAACGGPVSLGSATMSNGAATLSNSTQRFYTVAAGLTVGAASSGTFSGTASSGTFNVTSNSGLIFSDGFDGCRL